MDAHQTVVVDHVVVTQVDVGKQKSADSSAESYEGWRSRVFVYTVGTLASFILRALNFSFKWSYEGFENGRRNWPYEGPTILAFWHGHQLFMPQIYKYCTPKKGAPSMYALISQHKDGRLIARAVECLGIKSIAGSSTRGGREALFSLLRTLRGGDHVSVTPDGPKGPVYKVKPGVISIARKTGAKIYPTAIGYSRYWKIKSWDEMLLPKPFSHAVLVLGEPIEVPTDATEAQLQEYCVVLERALNEVTEQSRKSAQR